VKNENRPRRNVAGDLFCALVIVAAQFYPPMVGCAIFPVTVTCAIHSGMCAAQFLFCHGNLHNFILAWLPCNFYSVMVSRAEP
jgi:hypothetical protein